MARRKADAMEENITSDNNECTEVKLTRAQKYGSAPVEGSTSMTRQEAKDIIANLSERDIICLWSYLQIAAEAEQLPQNPHPTSGQ